MKELIERMPVKQIPNYMFRNNGLLTFEKVTTEWGLSQPSFSNACAYADFDNDGDLDLVINNVDQPPFLYRNNLERQHQNYLKIELSGPKENRNGIGSSIELRYDGKKQFIEYYVTRGFQSSMEQIHFGLGESQIIDNLIVTWFDGRQQILTGLNCNQQIELNYNQAVFLESRDNNDKPIFTSFHHGLTIDFRHRENEYDDYESQILLPHKYSQFGPGISVGDVN